MTCTWRSKVIKRKERYAQKQRNSEEEERGNLLNFRGEREKGNGTYAVKPKMSIMKQQSS